MKVACLNRWHAGGVSNRTLPPVWKFVAAMALVPPRTLPSVKAIFWK
jgi:hypothetical protein